MENTSPILQFFNESEIPVPVNQSSLASLLSEIAEAEQVSFEMVELVYVSEEEIIRVNTEFLDRNYVTDIISFRYDEDKENQAIEGTLYCCAPRIKEQADQYADSEEEEFRRIFIHGVLHLIGYEDRTPEQKNKMTELENTYLSI